MGTSKGYGGPSSGLRPPGLMIAQPAARPPNQTEQANLIHLSPALRLLSKALLRHGQ